MEKKIETHPTYVSVIGIAILLLLAVCHAEKSTYIVHMAKSEMPASFDHADHVMWYDSSLKSVSGSAGMIYTYDKAIHGFSTRLTLDEARKMEAQPGVLAVLPDTKYELHTTRTPWFLGLDQKLPAVLPKPDRLSDVVIGVLDTGVWPESKSFDDAGLGPVPVSWRGECEAGTNFKNSSCNRKLIGARYFAKGHEATHGPNTVTKEPKSARDNDGHGTHTSTTAAGSSVAHASLFGYAAGTARGMAPRARIAAYKVCWSVGCYSSDILKAIDKAIEDNVNVLSLSLGGSPADYYRDPIAMGALAAMEKGIFVSCAAGNSGPNAFSLSNVAPWLTTVGAGTIDRDFPALVKLGNGKHFVGVSLYKGGSLLGKKRPFVYAGDVSSNGSSLCLLGTLNSEKVKDKIVLCDRGSNPRVQKGAVVKTAGGAGMVLANTATEGEELVADAHFLPATTVGVKAGNKIKKYLSLEKSNATATIEFEATRVGVQPSPVVAAFSSRGPNPMDPEILKPDLTAPGVNILAGWSGAMGPTGLDEDPRRVEFNIISGTSMSCPHVSGLAALLKAAHPDWSPAAIRSALMTTAYTAYKNGKPMLDASTGRPSTPFDHGAGHVNPISALDPGLVYDLDMGDYLNFLCALNYTPKQINSLARRDFTCEARKLYSVNDLNYPSFAVSLQAQMGRSTGSTGSSVVKHTRTLTNVGQPGTYKVSISSSSDSVKISVDPRTLTFSQTKEKKSYTVTFHATSSLRSNSSVYGKIVWSDGKHVVGSPFAVSRA